MVGVAAFQLLLVALTACVGADTSGFLKSTAGAVIEAGDAQLPAVAPKQALPKPDANEEAVIKSSLQALMVRHLKQQGQLRASLYRYQRVTMRKYACTSRRTRAALKVQIVRRRRFFTKQLRIKQGQESRLILRKVQCMRKVPGDQSGVPGPQVQACMKANAMLEKAPVAQYQGLTLVRNKQIDPFQQMQEHAMNDSLQGLFNTELKFGIAQWTTSFEKDHKKELQQCEHASATDKKFGDAIKVMLKADAQKADKSERNALISGFQDALARAKKVMARTSDAA